MLAFCRKKDIWARICSTHGIRVKDLIDGCISGIKTRVNMDKVSYGMEG